MSHLIGNPQGAAPMTEPMGSIFLIRKNYHLGGATVDLKMALSYLILALGMAWALVTLLVS